MIELKEQQIALDIEDQVENLKTLGLIVNDENYAKKILCDISYFLYVLVELFSFGTLSKFFKNMKNKDKKAISNTFNVGYTYFESWIESIAFVRNICAHYGRLYNTKLTKAPILYKQYSSNGIGNNRAFSVMLCMKHLIKNDTKWKIFIDTMEALIEKYEGVDVKTMGFPMDWKKLLLE
jgi:abortive infection bacteriophage resistance protein